MSKGNRTKGPRAGRPRKKKSDLAVMTAMRLTPGTREAIGKLAEAWGCDRTGAVTRAVAESLQRVVG